MILGFLYFYTDRTKPFVKVISGSEVENYAGVSGYQGYDYGEKKEVQEIDTSPFDLAKHNLDEGIVGEFDFKEQNLVALIQRSYGESPREELNTIVILNKNTGQIEKYPAPLNSTWSTTHIAQVGDNIFLKIFQRVDMSRPYQPQDNNYYIFNVAKRQYERLQIDYDDIGYTDGRNFYILPNPNDNSKFAIGYCNTKRGINDCPRYGVAISDSIYIKKVMDVKMPFTIGWKDDNLFIKKDDKVYLVSSEEVK